ncbi:mechanosensitive ion channel family protein [Sphingobium aromaticiconvertens]|uniref:mechanosensitive ion channel family protein n=1 Tax=Sphingobium aromaticiconvertens TaxID=365341 RepID=UPI003017DA3B
MIGQLHIAKSSIDILTQGFVTHPWMQAMLAIAIMLMVAAIANWIAKRIVLRLILRLLERTSMAVEVRSLGLIVARLSNILPAVIVQLGIATVPHLPAWALVLVRNLCTAFIILTLAMALSGALNLLNQLYQRRPDAANRPIKGYVQLGKLLVYGACTILIIAALMDRSPLLLLSGLGAMAAVLMLVFKDTILSLVASVQIGSNDMIRVGDWIEMPQLNADGDVIDIALHTVKIQNFDKTITTVPTHRLINESFKNWRGMAESGGRRIKRSIMIDQNSVRFLTDEEITDLSGYRLLGDYLERKEAEITHFNAENGIEGDINARRLTNIGTFRAYVVALLAAHPDIARDKAMLVRQLAPGEYGLPLEIYAFATTTRWSDYEDIQADIFDHLLAILPAFGLRLFQRPTGLDLTFHSNNIRNMPLASSVAV